MSSGIVGVVILTVSALCFLLGYIASNNTVILTSISYARIFILFFSLVYGIFGVVIGAILLFGYLFNQKAFGVPFTHPLAPLDLHDLKQFFLTRSSTYYKRRLNVMKTEDKDVKKDS